MTERDSKGRFIKGNPGSPGRPPRLREDEYLDLLKDTIPAERWARIVEAVAHRAERGDVSAFKALAGYLAGLPLQRVSATVRTDGDEELTDAERATLHEYLAGQAGAEGLAAGG
jgi:hypothetical protein